MSRFLSLRHSILQSALTGKICTYAAALQMVCTPIEQVSRLASKAGDVISDVCGSICLNQDDFATQGLKPTLRRRYADVTPIEPYMSLMTSCARLARRDSWLTGNSDVLKLCSAMAAQVKSDIKMLCY